MNKEFMVYVSARAEKAVMENEEYRRLQNDCVKAMKDNDMVRYDEISSILDSKAQELCFVKGFIDGLEMGRRMMEG